MERKLEWLIFQTRWLLVPFYLGLAVALFIYLIKFTKLLVLLALNVLTLPGEEVLLTTLQLVDSVLVASLLVMVIISGYENFVSKLDIDTSRHGIGWLGKLDAGSLKVKVATSIVAISSIHLLQGFLNVASVDNQKLMWLVVIHMTFVVSALLLAYLDKLSAHKGGKHD